MNKIISLSSVLLTNILQEKVSFVLAIKNNLKDEKITQSERSLIIKFAGCSLRHYYIFFYLIETYLGKLNIHNQTLAMLYLSNQLFLNAIDREDAKKDFRSLLLQSGEITDDKVFDLLDEAIVDRANIIPHDLAKNSPEFLSYRFNTPLWLVKMWSKHFGEHLTYRILSGNSRPCPPVCLVNSSLIIREDLLAKYADLMPSSFSNFVQGEAKSNLKKHPAFIHHEILDISPCMQLVLDQADVDPLRGIAFYCGYPNNGFLSLLAKFGKDVRFDLVIGDGPTYIQSRKTLAKFDMNKAFIYEAAASSIITCISKPVHTFFLFPANSHFSLLKSTPDYFLHFSQEELDGIIKGEESALNECAPLVEENGELIYAIPTINKKESMKVIERFLLHHLEFSIASEKLIFPYSEYEDSFYFAILKKGAKKND